MADTEKSVIPAGPTQRQREKILEGLLEGLSGHKAAARARVTAAVFDEWLMLGESLGGDFHDFYLDCQGASAEFVFEIHRAINDHEADKPEPKEGEGKNWNRPAKMSSADPRRLRLQLDLLTKRFPKEYSEKRAVVEHRHTGSIESKMDPADPDRQISNMEREELQAELDRLQRINQARVIDAEDAVLVPRDG